MSGQILALVIVVIVVAAVVLGALTMRQRRTQTLKKTFGPEYEKAVQDTGSPSEAEAELESRRQRREQLDIRPISAESSARYEAQWKEVQVRFVDAPETSLREADTLVVELMRERGYPVEEFDQRAADISVDHPEVVQNYRAAHDVAVRMGRDPLTTDDLRIALQHYRDLFRVLLVAGESTGSEQATANTANRHQEGTR
jgi:cytoskeletal protein RodZ